MVRGVAFFHGDESPGACRGDFAPCLERRFDRGAIAFELDDFRADALGYAPEFSWRDTKTINA